MLCKRKVRNEIMHMSIILNNEQIITISFDLDETLIDYSTPIILANSAVVEYLKTFCPCTYLKI